MGYGIEKKIQNLSTLKSYIHTRSVFRVFHASKICNLSVFDFNVLCYGAFVKILVRVSDKGWRMANFTGALLTFEKYSP